MGDGLTITGGANGLAARYDDLLSHAGLLDEIASDLGEVATTLARMTVSPDLAEAAVLCPIEVARAEEALIAANVGSGGAGAAWARAEASVAFLRFAIAAYREADEALVRAGDGIAFAGGFAVGSAALPLAVGVASNPLLAAAVWVNRGPMVDGAQELAYDEPWIQEGVTRAAPGFVQGAVSSVLGGSPLLLGLVSGGHWPTPDLQGAVNGLLNVVGPAGLFRDSGEFSVAAHGAPKEVDFAPTSFVSELMRQQNLLSDEAATVQIVETRGPCGPSYVVQIPGTQAWGAIRRDNPVDLTTNLHLVAGRQTDLARAVVQAMRVAHIPRGAPVLLTGHSQGGIAAAAIASDPEYRGEFNIRAVITAGSPIGRMEIPEDVAVLSIESEQDVVPKLDGVDNPDRPSWVTVRRNLSAGTAPDPGKGVSAAHSLVNYQAVGDAIDASHDASVVAWRTAVNQFFGPGSGRRYKFSIAGAQ